MIISFFFFFFFKLSQIPTLGWFLEFGAVIKKLSCLVFLRSCFNYELVVLKNCKAYIAYHNSHLSEPRSFGVVSHIAHGNLPARNPNLLRTPCIRLANRYRFPLGFRISCSSFAFWNWEKKGQNPFVFLSSLLDFNWSVCAHLYTNVSICWLAYSCKPISTNFL